MSVSAPRFERPGLSRRLRRCVLPGAAIAASLGLLPADAAGQTAPSPSRWGVSVSVTPPAEAHEPYRELLYNFEGRGSVKSTEFTIGVVRGSLRGGDWGVSFVRKPVQDGSHVTESQVDCFMPTSCVTSTRTSIMREVMLTGVEFHWAPTFVTIARRVQIGINVGGGIASVSGDVEEVFITEFTDPFPPGSTHRQVGPAKDTLYAPQPLGKAEGQASVIVAPGFKIRVAGGFNAPGYGVRLGAVYLIGAR